MTPPVQVRASTLILVACTVWADDHIAILATAAVATVRRAGIHLMWDRRTPHPVFLSSFPFFRFFSPIRKTKRVYMIVMICEIIRYNIMKYL